MSQVGTISHMMRLHPESGRHEDQGKVATP